MSLTSEKDKGISVTPLDEEEPGPLPVSPSGPTHTAFVSEKKLESATPENLVCLKGPCMHYVEIKTRGQFLETEGSEGVVQVNRYCRCIPGDSIELTDMFVLACNQHTPRD